MSDDQIQERAYIRGHAAACAALLGEIVRQLHGDGLPEYDRDKRLAALEAERVWTVQALRRICAEHGDNDWPDNLFLPDVIEKHLERHLEE